MITPSLPSNLANVISPFSPVGKEAVGEENIEARNTPFKPVEELAESERRQSRMSSSEQAALAEESVREQPDNGSRRVPGEQSGEEAEQRSRQEAEAAQEREQQQQEQQLISELASRDREVRAHEQAHSAVGGALAGSPSYQYQRGPDGVSYAIGGEVPISTGEVPGDPEATLQNARRVQQAALAPADPSPQDRSVAAEAARLQSQAIQEIAARDAAERQLEAEQLEAEREEKARLQQEQQQAQAEKQQQRQEMLQEQQAERAIEFENNNIDLNRRLIEIGALPSSAPVGGLLNLLA